MAGNSRSSSDDNRPSTGSHNSAVGQADPPNSGPNPSFSTTGRDATHDKMLKLEKNVDNLRRELEVLAELRDLNKPREKTLQTSGE
ncbi:MAG: hypothetical protein L6R38_005113 [Xanthoria sp. 2 TBL-2021]|nr:MAG: hypothetical protein L6R38_005113 [Xanthoria sp. 2 TBL-2021]